MVLYAQVLRGSHGLLGRCTSTRLIIRGPGSRTPSPTLRRCSTLLGLGAAQTPPGIDGRDLAALWSGEGDTAWRQSLFLPYRDLMRAVRDERYKLIVYPKVNHRQLFDLADDPDELHNLAADPAHRQTLARLEIDSLNNGAAPLAEAGADCNLPIHLRSGSARRDRRRRRPTVVIRAATVTRRTA